MIATLEGILAEVNTQIVVLDVNGVGYEVHIPLTLVETLPETGKTVKLFTIVLYREDAQTLYGFSSKEAREFFKLLVEKVSGVGPKLALSIISNLSLQSLREAIVNEDAQLLSQCPGIGKKTAERLIIELKDKIVSHLSPLESLSRNRTHGTVDGVRDAVAALMKLGYRAPDADKAIRKAVEQMGTDSSTEALIRHALGRK